MRRADAGPAALLLGFLIVAGCVLAGLAGAADLRLLLAVRGPDDGGLTAAAALLTKLGAISLRGPIALAGAALLLVAKRWRAAAALISVWGGESLLAEAVKTLVDRPRPDAAWRLVDIASTSFPSAHAAGAAALYPLLGWLVGGLIGRRAAMTGAGGGIALALLIGLTRLVLGVHWPTDVLAGWLLGGAIAWFGAVAVQRAGAR